jgi:transketolase
MPSVEIFLAQDEKYRTTVLGHDLPIATIEAGVTFGWERFSGTAGLRIGIDHFGTSAPASVIAEEWGFTPQAVADRLVGWLSVS